MTRVSAPLRLGLGCLVLASALGAPSLLRSDDAPAAADGNASAENEKQDSEARPARVVTRSGELIVGQPDLPTVAIRTKYGVLEVPVEDVRQINLAWMLDDDDRTRLATLLEEHGAATSDEERESTRDELYRVGRIAFDELQAAVERASPEAQQAAAEIVSDLASSDLASRTSQDTVFAKRFTIRGVVLLDEARVESAYGDLLLTRNDIDRISFGSGSIWGGSTDTALIVKTWTDPSGEFANTKNAISKETSIRLVEYEGQSTSDLTNALRKYRVIILPEFENAGNSAQVAAEAAKKIQKFVKQGGVIISCGGNANIQFLAQAGLLECSGSSNNTPGQIRKKHPIVRGVSGAIPYANATFPMQVTGSRKMTALAQGNNGGIVVGVATIGAGAVVYCGWDFYDSAEPHQRVLGNAVDWATSYMGGFDDF